MIARTLTVDVGSDRLDDVVRSYRELVRPIHQGAAGLRTHLVLVNRNAGRVAFVGVWDSDDAVSSVADELEPARERLWASFGQAPDLDLFEVVDQIGVDND